MTFSVPSFFAAAMSAFMPPPAASDVAVTHFLSLAPDDEPPDDEHAVATSARAATPASANLCDLIRPPRAPVDRGLLAASRHPGRRRAADRCTAYCPDI